MVTINAKPIISYALDAVINQEGEEERINHWANKKWKLGGDIHAPMKNRSCPRVIDQKLVLPPCLRKM